MPPKSILKRRAPVEQEQEDDAVSRVAPVVKVPRAKAAELGPSSNGRGRVAQAGHGDNEDEDEDSEEDSEAMAGVTTDDEMGDVSDSDDDEDDEDEILAMQEGKERPVKSECMSLCALREKLYR